jgi:CheY-like chemotaxis protein
MVGPQASRSISNRTSALIVVVEDEDAIRHLIRDTLEGEGYRVRTARSAEDAIVLLNEVTPSLILLDVRLPGMDGFAFVDAYRKRIGDVKAPIMLVSALRPPEALPQGVVGYLRKPFDLEDLLSRVERCMTP